MKRHFLLPIAALMAAGMMFIGCKKDDEPSAEDYYHVHFCDNGATSGSAPEDMTLISGKKYTIPVTMSKKGCSFLGFVSRGDNRITYCTEGDELNYTFTYYPYSWDCKYDTIDAIWDHYKFTITYHSNGATGSEPQPIIVDLPKHERKKYDRIAWDADDFYNPKRKNLPDTIILDNGDNLKKDGYVFVGWNTKADGTGVFLPKGYKLVKCDEDIDLYAVFENHNGHEYVDLGLPSGTLWAKTNIGTTCEAKEGYLFAYGETKPKDKYTHENWELLDDEWDDMFTLMTDTYHDGLYINGKQNEKYDNTWFRFNLMYMQDAASTNWGKLWRIPSIEDWEELFDNCTVEDYDYVLIEEGETLPSKILRSKNNGNYIIIPDHTYFSINHNRGDIYELKSGYIYKTGNDSYFTQLRLRFLKEQNSQTTRPVWRSNGSDEYSRSYYWNGVCVRPVTKLK